MGADPGTGITGYGVIECAGGVFTPLDYGCIRPPKGIDINDKYLIIHNSIDRLLQQYKPTVLVVETQYLSKNFQSVLKLGMAKAAIILAAKRLQIEVVEYSPSTVKKAVTGRGGAGKEQVQGMTQKLLSLKEPPHPEDAADALALAICHAQKILRPICISNL